MSIYFHKLGELFKARAVIQKEQTPAWAIALGLALYAQGLSLRRTAVVLTQMGVRISHVSVWYWIQAFADNWSVWDEEMPDTVVVDETRVKLGGRTCWIWAAIDPDTRRILYLKVSRDRSLITTAQFFAELAHVYGKWPKEAVVDGGPWYQGALFFLQRTKHNWMVGGIRNYVERRFREFKRRVKVFDVSFPQHRTDYRSINNWLRIFAWHHNQNLVLKELFGIS